MDATIYPVERGASDGLVRVLAEQVRDALSAAPHDIVAHSCAPHLPWLSVALSIVVGVSWVDLGQQLRTGAG